MSLLQIKSQFASIKKAHALASKMGVGRGDAASTIEDSSGLTDGDVRQISMISETAECDMDEEDIDSIVEAAQLEEYQHNVEMATE